MKPLLSVGIIFKNEIRCLERCLKSLQPLREAVPCELVMADTGSGDGSREVAAKYADILFDFPWIDDFAAARNAVIDRCHGEWYLSIDADEWLDGDIAQLVRYLTHPERWERPLCGVMLRNYYTPELDGESNDFLAVRMARLSTGARFTGAIHELWNLAAPVCALEQTLLHHDGYVDFNENYNQEKHERNMKLLREKLEREPEDLKTLLQCIESSTRTASYDSYVRRAVEALKKKPGGWKYYAPPILRYAVLWAAGQKLPELKEWSDWLLSEFPDSPYTGIDAAYVLFISEAEKQEYDAAIPYGERYLRTMEDYRAGRIDLTAMVFGSFVMATRSREDGARAVLADAYFHSHEMEKAREMLLSIDRARMRPETAANYIGILMNLHAQSGEDLSGVLADFWEKTDRPEPWKKQGEACRRAMVEAAQAVFSTAHWQAEEENGFRHAYTLFLPLAGKCALGNGAAVLAADTAEEMQRALRDVEGWRDFPAAALVHAVLSGAAFPLPENPLNLEDMDLLAARLAREPESLFRVLDAAAGDFAGSWQTLAWARGLALAAVQGFGWDSVETGMRLARTFARVEAAFLTACYAPEVLREGNLCVLPPMHRFGWHCVQAFNALAAGDAAGYARSLRAGLETHPDMKPMVKFLLDNTPELQGPAPSWELMELAEKVRAMLASFPADDPAVAALKASPAYQRVAGLIEGGGQ